jgi:hypothetical protein
MDERNLDDRMQHVEVQLQAVRVVDEDPKDPFPVSEVGIAFVHTFGNNLGLVVI